MRIDRDVFVHNDDEKNVKINLMNENRKLKTEY